MSDLRTLIMLSFLLRNAFGDDKFAECVPFGVCEQCPEHSMDELFCQPFGNRQLFHCQPLDPSQPGEVPIWEGCGRIVKRETRDYGEFLVSNVAIAVIALLVVFVRMKLINLLRSKNLYTRIGMYR